MVKRSVGEHLARRGVLAGAAALVAGALAKASERVARAAGNGAALTMGNNDDATNAPTSQDARSCAAAWLAAAPML